MASGSVRIWINIFLVLVVTQPSLEEALGFVQGFRGVLPCNDLILRGSPSEIRSSCPTPRVNIAGNLHGLRSLVARRGTENEKDQHKEPRLGSAHSIQQKHFNPPKQEEDKSIPARVVRAVKGAFGHDDDHPTLLGSSSLRILHDQIVPDQDQLPNGGKSETLEAIHNAVTGTVEMLQNPEKAAEESGGWILLGSRRIGWLASKAQALPSLVMGSDGSTSQDGSMPESVSGSLQIVASGKEKAVPASSTALMTGPAELEPQKKKEGKFRVQTEMVNVGIEKIYSIAADLVNYPTWCGTGIKSVEILKQDGPVTEAKYKAGAFGYMFDFVLAFQTHAYDTISFKMLEGGSVKRLEGEYRFEPESEDTCKVHFELCAELAGFIPNFVQNSIGNMIMAIAVGELCKYCESTNSPQFPVA